MSFIFTCITEWAIPIFSDYFLMFLFFSEEIMDTYPSASKHVEKNRRYQI